MAEIHVSTDEQLGIKKEIDSGAYGLVFQAIQEDIYSFPIRSFVRETISNGLDSIIERDQAKDIILNGAEPAKYYRQLHDNQLLKDSSFDKYYYDVKHLSSDNTVNVTYTEKSGRDVISIQDKGVGLGGERLRGFFKIGYSSKRNMKSVMGKFGSGSKSGLSTGVPYFIIHTVYNGYKSSFMILKLNYEPITPKTLNGKEEVWQVTMANDSKKDLHVYWQKVDEPNSVTIELEVKKHNKEAYINAVIDQFQYFKGKVVLNEISEYLDPVTRVLNSNPFYESDVLLIPNVSTYNAPHILVDGINYGVVSWEELELNKRYGKIAIKVSASDVDITQSRETLKWTEKTKTTILTAIKLAEDEASDYMTNALTLDNKENIFEFNNKYSSVRSSSGDNVTFAFSRFLDMHKVRPKFTFTLFKGYDNEITLVKPLDDRLFKELFYKFTVKIVKVSSKGAGKVSIISENVNFFHELVNLPIVFADDSTLGPKRAQYLIDSRFTEHDSFVYIRNSTSGKDRISTLFEEHVTTDAMHLYMNYMVQKCCSVNIDDENWEEIEAELTEEEEVESTEESRAKYRKDNQILLYQEYPSYSETWRSNTKYESSYEKKELLSKELVSEFEGEELIICTGSYRHLGKILDTVKFLMGSHQRVIYVSQQAVKSFLPHGVFITDYIRKFNPKTKELMVGKLLKDLGTLKHFQELAKKYYGISAQEDKALLFLEIDHDKYKSLNKKKLGCDSIERILNNNFKNDEETVSTIMNYLELVTKFQKVLSTGDESLILEESKKLFNGEEVFNLDSYDKDFIDELNVEFERVSICSPLIEDMNTYPSEETVKLVNELINYKNSNNVNI